ncbi:dienelactone hydrolase family protein [Pseudoroseomonas sp. WGS1072]|uniref:dienelactone hydrolase family protein n=1 Tax=Roseomonas sp. WGS1072 TaxID=3366816 RepID=UPI003BF44962
MKAPARTDNVVPLADGPADVHLAHPTGPGPWPVLIFYMDAPGIRDELHRMAARFAAAGYCVVLPNLFYRAGLGFRLPRDCTDPSAPSHQRMVELFMSLSVPQVMSDTAALLDWLETQPAADTGRIGTLGYCMSGRFALAAAQKWPHQVRAAASVYGTGLVTEEAESPHRLAAAAPGNIYVAFAELDQHAPAAHAAPMREAFQAAGREAEVEVLPGVDHGFGFAERPTYDERASEHVWGKLLALFQRSLP